MHLNSLYSELQWLPPSPSDFSARLRRISASEWTSGFEIQSIASFSLNLNQLTRLASVMEKKAPSSNLAPLTPFSLGLLSNSTTELITPALIATAARHGIALDLIVPPYDQVAQQALTHDSIINNSNLDAVLLAIDFRSLPLQLSVGELETSTATISAAIAYLKTLRDGIKAHSKAVCIFQNFAMPVESLFGSLDRHLPGTLRNLIDGINRELAAFVNESGDILFDVSGVAECVGLSNWHAPDLWNMAKIPFSCDFVPLYADHVARILAALRGKSRKVLILDLDNTVWGGIIGDDGVEGIQIAQGDARGEAHLAVQRFALGLRQRGIILAVSSKNTDETARIPFETHPEMLLRLHHFTVFQANWNDKATNIKAIAEELSLSLDSIVFMDDNPVERDLVRQFLPQVAVPELPEDPAYYVRTLSAAGYFEAVTLTDEDLTRASAYADNAKRASLKHSAGDMDEYLEALDMTITFMPFDASGRTRIVQLINKSNQYNLTTRRYTEPQIADITEDPEVLAMQIRLADRFGDNGMISVLICRPEAQTNIWNIDTWLMSCRVLGRKVEHMVLAELLQHANAAGIDTVTGTYRPTAKNKMVSDHYARLGFSKVDEAQDGTSYWKLLVNEATPQRPPMKLISHIAFKTLERTPA